MWTILTENIGEETYFSVINRWLILKEQKGCHKRTKWTDLLYTDQHIVNEIQTRRRNLDKEWINNKKVYDMIQRNGTIDCFKMSKISGEVKKVIKNTKKKKNTQTWNE